MKTYKKKCLMCNNKFMAKEWKAKKGLLKGETIISSVYCSRKCRKKFDLFIALNDVLEAIEELNNSRRKS